MWNNIKEKQPKQNELVDIWHISKTNKNYRVVNCMYDKKNNIFITYNGYIYKNIEYWIEIPKSPIPEIEETL